MLLLAWLPILLGTMTPDAWCLAIAVMFSLSLLGLRYLHRLNVSHLCRQLSLQQQIIDVSNEAMLLTDAQRRIVAVNPAFERITGYSAADVLDQTPELLLSGHHGEDFCREICAAVEAQGAWSGEVWNRSKRGEIYLQQLSLRRVDDARGRPQNYVALFSDISLQKAQEARIEYLAHHDLLTGLPNRAALAGYLNSAMARVRRDGGHCAVLVLDLDNFKTVNDSLGHHAGDRLLCEVASRLLRLAGSGNRVLRMGGDEFVLLIEQAGSPEQIVEHAEAVRMGVSAAFELDGHELHITPSIGISLFPLHGDTPEALVRNADTAMYHAKADGRNSYQFFAEPMNAAVNRRLVLESELWQALAGNQLLLHYQPQVDLGSGAIVGVEALVRWQHPQRGLIPPGEFIPVAEECGLILSLGHWVLLNACRQARAWIDAGLEMGEMAVNISAHQFRQPDFVDLVRNVLVETGLPAERLELEITETAVMHSADSSVTTLAELKAMGVRLAIDDFGTGYSSLAYLRRFPIDRLKIDRAFVADLESDPDAASLVASIIALGRSLDLRLVAEGVENSAQADFLRDMACERVQGFHFYRPAAAEQLANGSLWLTPVSQAV